MPMQKDNLIKWITNAQNKLKDDCGSAAQHDASRGGSRRRSSQSDVSLSSRTP